MNIRELIAKWHAKRVQARIKQTVEDADRLFQVTEYEGSLWLTYGGDLIAPMIMITASGSTPECIALVQGLRDRYINRKYKEYVGN